MVRPKIEVKLCNWGYARPEASRIRELVFVREQGVPAEIEIDDADPVSDHALANVPGLGIVGTGRLLPDGHIGRLAVLSNWRGQGVGAALLDTLIELARLRGHKCVRLNAQTSAAGFYRKAGFEACGPEFMEVDIPHVAMQRSLQD